jgi:probable phosphoglycerate mutase
MTRILLVRSGSTDFDEQGRIKGTLDIPLSHAGTEQVLRIVADLSNFEIDHVYASPCRSALQTAETLAKPRRLRVHKLKELQNLDHGLWHGKLIEEVKHSQPKVYRQLQDHPETVCPPEGEPVGEAMKRVQAGLAKILKKHREGVVALVVPEPVASMARCLLEHCELGDLWKAECESASWQWIDLEAATAAAR